MHELSLARAIVKTALDHADGRRVVAVNVRAGALRQVVPDSLQFYFEFVARETSCEDARLGIETLPAVVRCRTCAEQWELDRPLFRCHACGGSDVMVVSGEELEVESIEVEEAECIAPK
jgi:hydrogenase nickel incorporation protein HypA/HybF